MNFWRRELAADSNATWFVNVEATRLHVLAPPGVSISRRLECDARFRQESAGWRWGVWNRESPEHWPLIDDEPPSALREIDTQGVLRLLEQELHELVWACLWAQLQIARRIGRQRRDTVPSEDLARAGALSVAWLSHELVRAFPERAPLLETEEPSWAFGPVEAAPDDPAELTLPPCADPLPAALDREQSLRATVLHLVTLRFLAAQPKLFMSGPRVWRAGDRLAGYVEVTSSFDAASGDWISGPGTGRKPGDWSSYDWGNGFGPATEELSKP